MRWFVLSDIGDRKLMEADMSESEERFRALVEWLPDAMLVHQGGKVIYANPAAIKILAARSATALEGKPLLELIDPLFHQTVQASLKDVSTQRGGAPLAEWRCVRLDGTPLDVQARSSFTLYDAKQVTITSLHDISARKQADGVARPVSHATATDGAA